LGLGGIVGLLGNDLCPFFGVLHELWLSDWVILVALENYKKKKKSISIYKTKFDIYHDKN